MNENDYHFYSTLDTYEAGYLSLLGHPYELVSENGGKKYSFHFPVSDALHQDLYQYKHGTKVEALQFAQSVKTIRSAIFRKRSGENGSVGNVKNQS